MSITKPNANLGEYTTARVRAQDEQAAINKALAKARRLSRVGPGAGADEQAKADGLMAKQEARKKLLKKALAARSGVRSACLVYPDPRLRRVTISYSLLRAQHKELSLPEQRLLALFISKANWNAGPIRPAPLLSVELEEFAESAGVTKALAYRQLKACHITLPCRRTHILEGDAVATANWVQFADFDGTTGRVRVQFVDAVMQQLRSFGEEGFATYRLSLLRGVHTRTAARILQLCALAHGWEDRVDFRVSELLFMLDANASDRADVGRFLDRTVRPAVRDIQKMKCREFTVERVTVNRQLTGISFRFPKGFFESPEKRAPRQRVPKKGRKGTMAFQPSAPPTQRAAL